MLLNTIVFFVNILYKRKHALTTLSEMYSNAKRIMKRYHKIRWLSRWLDMTALYD